MLIWSHKGEWEKAFKYLDSIQQFSLDSVLKQAGEMGVEALSQASPIRTGRMSRSWTYKINRGTNDVSIEWHNTDIEGGCNVALLVQYGHGKHGGGYIQGRDFINPAMEPVFDEIIKMVGEGVKNL